MLAIDKIKYRLIEVILEKQNELVRRNNTVY